MNIGNTLSMLMMPANIILLVSLLSACGNSNSVDELVPPEPPGVTLSSGQLIDSQVAGIDYSSGDTQGVTDQQGYFEYEVIGGVSQRVVFSFNRIEIGSAIGKEIITPIDLVVDGNINQLQVVNRASFLMVLDSDGDPSNGISPSVTLLDNLSGFSWAPIDFSSDDFKSEPELINLIADINSVDDEPHILPASEVAQLHLTETLACQSSGIYAGSFEGEDHGQFVMLLQDKRIDPLVFGDGNLWHGVTSALIYSSDQDRLIGVLPQQGLKFDSNNSFITGQANNGAEFSGDLINYSQIENGIWRNDVEGGSGTFIGERAAGATDAIYRLSGGFGDNTPFEISDDTADNTGGITLDIFTDGSVSGLFITARGEQFELNGTLQEETIIASSNNGLEINLTFDPNGDHPLSDLVGLFGLTGFWGSWQTADQNGGIAGTSCILNFG